MYVGVDRVEWLSPLNVCVNFNWITMMCMVQDSLYLFTRCTVLLYPTLILKNQETIYGYWFTHASLYRYFSSSGALCMSVCRDSCMIKQISMYTEQITKSLLGLLIYWSPVIGYYVRIVLWSKVYIYSVTKHFKL